MSEEITLAMWEALTKLAQGKQWFDERYKDWGESMKPYFALAKLGYATFITTGPGDSVTEFRITEAGAAKLQEKP
jgi:hypothetical protein